MFRTVLLCFFLMPLFIKAQDSTYTPKVVAVELTVNPAMFIIQSGRFGGEILSPAYRIGAKAEYTMTTGVRSGYEELSASVKYYFGPPRSKPYIDFQMYGLLNFRRGNLPRIKNGDLSFRDYDFLGAGLGMKPIFYDHFFMDFGFIIGQRYYSTTQPSSAIFNFSAGWRL